MRLAVDKTRADDAVSLCVSQNRGRLRQSLHVLRDSEIRGKFRSRTIESLYDEAKILVDEYGVKELNIVAQDITRYGIDLYNEYALLKLLDKITSLDVEWVRLLYCYPELLSDDLIKYIAKTTKFANMLTFPCNILMIRY